MDIAKNRCEWIAGLRASGHRQYSFVGTDGLTYYGPGGGGDEVCALQVAKETLHYAGYRSSTGWVSLTFDEVMKELGLESNQVIHDNDTGMTFAQIADAAEAGRYWTIEANVVPLAQAA